MAQKVKQETEPELEPDEDEETDPDGGEDDSAGSDTVPSGGDLAGYVRSIIKEVLGDGAPAGGRRTRVDDEDEIFHRVKAAQDKLKTDEEREGRFRKVEETLEKVLERPPARSGFAGKLQRIMWGEE